VTFDKPHRPCSEGHLCIPTRSITPIRWWIEAQVQPNVQHVGRASLVTTAGLTTSALRGEASVFMSLRLHDIQSCRLMRRRSVGDGTTGRRSDDLTWANECSPDERQVTKFRGFSAVALARKPQIGTFTPTTMSENPPQLWNAGCRFRTAIRVARPSGSRLTSRVPWLCPARCPSDGDHFLKWCLQTFTLPATAYRRPSTSL